MCALTGEIMGVSGSVQRACRRALTWLKTQTNIRLSTISSRQPRLIPRVNSVFKLRLLLWPQSTRMNHAVGFLPRSAQTNEDYDVETYNGNGGSLVSPVPASNIGYQFGGTEARRRVSKSVADDGGNSATLPTASGTVRR